MGIEAEAEADSGVGVDVGAGAGDAGWVWISGIVDDDGAAGGGDVKAGCGGCDDDNDDALAATLSAGTVDSGSLLAPGVIELEDICWKTWEGRNLVKSVITTLMIQTHGKRW